MKFHQHNPLRGIALDVLRSTVEWCAEHIYLSPRIPTARPGQWRSDNVAALCRPGGLMDALDDVETETVVVAKGSQTALTTTAYCWLAKCIATDPGSALIVMNSTQDARDKAAETWRPMWEDSPRLKQYLPTCRRKDWTKLYQLLNRSPVYWIGANSAGRLGAKPIRRLILDEVDKYPTKFGGSDERREAGAAALAEQRTKTFRQSGLAKILKFSTPTLDTGEIWRSYEQGDQRKLYVKCHACGGEQVMLWASFRIDMDLARSDPGAAVAGAHYECPHCKQPWTDAQRWAAIDAGEWRPTVKARDPLCRSFWLPSWCSKMVTHTYLAAQWIKAQDGTAGLQNFVNGECGEPWRHYENQVRDSVFSVLEGVYEEGEKFTEIEPYKTEYKERESFVLCGCDVQKGYLVPVFRQFVRGGDSALVWSGTVMDFAALEGLRAKFGAEFVFVDRRYRQREVDEWAFAHTGYIPCEGVRTRARSLFSVGVIDLEEGRSRHTGQRTVATISFDPDQIKDLLAATVQKAKGTPRWLVPKGYPSNTTYCAQMTAERCINGRWINGQNKANHLWDSECLCLLAAIQLRIWDVVPPEEEQKRGEG